MNGIDAIPLTNNWIKYCLGNVLFDKIKQKYYYDKNKLLEACNSNNIYDYEDYVKLYSNDKGSL